jgi:hypothetical protein
MHYTGLQGTFYGMRSHICTYLVRMQKRIRIVKKGEDDGNLRYWSTQTYRQRMVELERMRRIVNKKQYGDRPKFSRVYSVVKRSRG